MTGDSGGPEIPVPQAGDSGLFQAEGSAGQDLGPSSSSSDDAMHSEDQGQHSGQDGDTNDQDDSDTSEMQ